MFYNFASDSLFPEEWWIAVWFIETDLAAIIRVYEDSPTEHPSVDDFSKLYQSVKRFSKRETLIPSPNFSEFYSIETALIKIAYSFLDKQENVRLDKQRLLMALSRSAAFRQFLANEKVKANQQPQKLTGVDCDYSAAIIHNTISCRRMKCISKRTTYVLGGVLTLSMIIVSTYSFRKNSSANDRHESHDSRKNGMAIIASVTKNCLPMERKCRQTLLAPTDALAETALEAATIKNSAANELFSLAELPDGVVADLARMSASPDEDDVWRDYCLQFLGSALERTDGVTDTDRALARETLVEALASTNATFAGTALRALHRAAPADPLVASNALRIARDPAYPAPSRTTALLVLEKCSSLGADGSAAPPDDRQALLRETAAALSADSSGSPLLRQTAAAVLQRLASAPPNP